MAGILGLALRQLRARPLRAALTAIAVALGVAAVLGVQLALAAVDDQAGAAQLQRAGRSSLDVRAVGAAGLDPAAVDTVRSLAGVAEVQPFLEKPVTARIDKNAVDAPTVSVVTAVAGEVAMRPLILLDGRPPAPGSRDEVAVDQALAVSLESTGGGHPLRVGDAVYLTTASGPDRYRVVGITAGTSGGLAFTRSALYVSDTAARSAFALGLRTPLLAVRLAPGTDPGAVAAAVRDRLGPAAISVDPRAGTVQPLQDQRPLLLLLAALSVVIGAGVTANSVAVGAFERRREIGLLRAAGASRRQVFRLLLAEASLLALGGAVAGIGLGWLLGTILIRHYAASDLAGPTPSLDWLRTAGAVVAGGGAALLGSVFPAVAARNLSPLRALRQVPGAERDRAPRWLLAAVPPLFALFGLGVLVDQTAAVVVGTVGLLLGVCLALPAVAPPVIRGLGAVLSPGGGAARVAAANLARRRNRTALTLAGLSAAVATATAIGVLTAAALDTGDHWIGNLFAGDVLVTSPATQADAIATDILDVDGVDAVSPVRYLVGTVGDVPLTIAAVDPVTYSGAGRLDLLEGDRTTAFTQLGEAPSAFVPAQLAQTLGWHAGQRLSLVVGGHQPATLTVAGVVAHSLPSGDNREALLVGRSQARALFGDSARGFDLLEVTAGSDAAAQRVAVRASTYGMRATAVATLRDAAHDALAHAIAILVALAWLAVTVAMLAVVNTLVASVRLGGRELALLRAVGLSRRRALRLLLTEAGLLAVTGIVIGVGTGCLAAIPLLRASGSPGFDLPFAFPVLGTLAAVAAILAGSLLASIVPGRRSARASIVAAIRDE